MSLAGSNLKELNFHLELSESDYAVKIRHADEFLRKGINVRLQLKFRGREMHRQEDGFALIRRMKSELAGVGVSEAEPKLTNKSIFLMLTPIAPDKGGLSFSP